MTADEFNARFKVGTAVVAYPGSRDGLGVRTATRSPAELLGGHTPVVWVDGVDSCIALTHIDLTEGGV